jgi:hypothetical protein
VPLTVFRPRACLRGAKRTCLVRQLMAASDR